MKPLPPTVTRIVAPEVWSPSQLAQGTECRLRALFVASRSVPSLITHPRASVGAVMHRLLENAARGATDRRSNIRAAVEAEFHRLLVAEETSLRSSEETSHFGSLSQTFTEAAWHNHVQSNLAAATSLLARAPVSHRRGGKPSGETLDFANLDGLGAWPEVSIHSDSLRLAGRMDYVEILSDETVWIRDHKGGRILDRDGTVHPSIQLQLRLYGLAVLSHRPQSQVQLTVSNGNREYEVSFDNSDIEETLSWLAGLLSATPAGVEQPCAAHANPGRACSHCPHRHVCPAYHEVSPRIWREGLPDGPPALDTWGVVTHAASSNGSTNLDVIAASAKRVRIHRLDTSRHQLEDVKYGQHVWLFGLATASKRVVCGRHIHPRNFYELPAAASDLRAWSLCVFGREMK